MRLATASVLALLALPASAQVAVPSLDPWQALSFLQGTWEARTGSGSAAKVVGTYSFQKELKGHVLARHAVVAECIGPQDFDCQHTDVFYVYQDGPGNKLRALYLDNEGHVIHYSVSAPDASTVVFLSEPGDGPRFRLVYHLEAGVLYGKFQSQMPAHDDWNSYLEWSGGRR